MPRAAAAYLDLGLVYEGQVVQGARGVADCHLREVERRRALILGLLLTSCCGLWLLGLCGWVEEIRNMASEANGCHMWMGGGDQKYGLGDQRAPYGQKDRGLPGHAALTAMRHIKSANLSLTLGHGRCQVL